MIASNSMTSLSSPTYLRNDFLSHLPIFSTYLLCRCPPDDSMTDYSDHQIQSTARTSYTSLSRHHQERRADRERVVKDEIRAAVADNWCWIILRKIRTECRPFEYPHFHQNFWHLPLLYDNVLTVLQQLTYGIFHFPVLNFILVMRFALHIDYLSCESTPNFLQYKFLITVPVKCKVLHSMGPPRGTVCRRLLATTKTSLNKFARRMKAFSFQTMMNIHLRPAPFGRFCGLTPFINITNYLLTFNYLLTNT